jgi:TolB-like protein/DNA-binding winged helix-turn-helix (wHTH) protein/Tfp pilus assembly protein PilF
MGQWRRLTYRTLKSPTIYRVIGQSKYRVIEYRDIEISKTGISRYRGPGYRDIEDRDIEISDYRRAERPDGCPCRLGCARITRIRDSAMEDRQAWVFDDFELDLRTWRLTRGGTPIALEPKALEVLALLVERSGAVVTKAEILDRVWKDTAVTENAMVRVIAQIRTALGDDAKRPTYLETVHTRGYRFIAPVTRTSREQKHRGLPSRRVAVAAVLLIAAAGALAWAARRTTVPPSATAPIDRSPASIAILPLENLGSPANQYFADGLTEALTTQLSKIEALKVMARGAVLRYGADRPAPSVIAKALSVAHLIEGSALLVGDRVRITARLVDGMTDRTIWAENYDGELRDILALQRRVAREIAREIRVRLTSDEEARLNASRAIDPEAYREYLHGLTEMEFVAAVNRDLFAHQRRALEHFRRAIAIEPAWGEAHGALSFALHNVAAWSDDAAERRTKTLLARDAAERAVDLDPTVVRARLALARTMFWLEDDWDSVDRQYREVLRLEPNNADPGYGSFLVYAGRFDEGIARLRHALERWPTNVAIRASLAGSCVCARRYDDAALEAAELRRLGEDTEAALIEARVLAAREQFAAAIALLTRHRDALMVNRSTTYFRTLGWVAARAGDAGRARQAIDRLKTLGNPPPAAILFALGEREEAARVIEAAYEQRDFSVRMIRCSPEFENYRTVPRIEKALRASRLPGLDR